MKTTYVHNVPPAVRNIRTPPQCPGCRYCQPATSNAPAFNEAVAETAYHGLRRLAATATTETERREYSARAERQYDLLEQHRAAQRHAAAARVGPVHGILDGPPGTSVLDR
jgi:hypothetical protein